MNWKEANFPSLQRRGDRAERGGGGRDLRHFRIPDHPDRVFDAATPPLQGGELAHNQFQFNGQVLF